jgi:vacuolar-type H+-ATPase subunit H
MMASDSLPTSRSLTDYLERLDALLGSSPPIYQLGKRAVYDAEVRELLRGLRDALSRETAGAQAEAEAALRRAQEEARRIVVEAQDYARRIKAGEVAAPTADGEIGQARERASREAEEVRREADAYALHVLERLEGEVSRVLATVRRGKALLVERVDEHAGAHGRNGHAAAPPGAAAEGRAVASVPGARRDVDKKKQESV